MEEDLSDWFSQHCVQKRTIKRSLSGHMVSTSNLSLILNQAIQNCSLTIPKINNNNNEKRKELEGFCYLWFPRFLLQTSSCFFIPLLFVGAIRGLGSASLSFMYATDVKLSKYLRHWRASGRNLEALIGCWITD